VSDEQKGKLKTIEDDSRKEMRDAFQGGGGGGGATDGARAKIAEMRKASMDKAVGVLSDDQKKAWKDMTGAPFEVKFEGGTGGGGRRPRGNNNT